MAEVIMNCQYVYTQYSSKTNANGKSNKINTNDMCDYYEREEACDYTNYEGIDDDQHVIDTNRAFDYYNYRVGSTGGFGKNGDFKKGEANRLIEKYKPDVMYRMVFSFENEFAQDTNIIVKSNMQKLMTKSMNKVIRDMGLDPNNVEWGCYYHTNTKHPHVHAWIFEKEKTKGQPQIRKKQFKKMRSDIVRTLGLNAEMYIQRDETKKMILDSLKEKGLNDKDINDYLSSKNNSKKTFKLDKAIGKELIELEKVLPKSGSMKYNSKNIRPYHDQIENMIDQILQSDEVRDFYGHFKEQLNQEKKIFDKRYFSDKEKMEKNKSIENKDRELRDKIANMILSNIKNYRMDVESYEQEFGNDEIEGNHSSSENGKKNGSKKERKRKHRVISYCAGVRGSNMKAGAMNELARMIDEGVRANAIEEMMLENMKQRARTKSIVQGGINIDY